MSLISEVFDLSLFYKLFTQASTMTIPELKTHLRLSAVLSHYGLVPDKHGKLRCPWHADKTPSLQVYLKTDSWTCFSSKCEAGSGDQLDFIMKYEGISKHEALKKAETLVSHSLIHLPVPTHTRSSLITKMGLLIKLYQTSQHAISRSTKAKAYAASRKLDIETLQLGYPPPAVECLDSGRP
ncbi:MAG: CHC2 zinc finger domain-containing protein [Bacteroidota bacterium]